ncbi:MAG: hypothetical protein NVSMB9_05790 [Isosphaeraceae bacterium]
MFRLYVRNFLVDDEAVTATEYAVMLVLIIVSVIAAVNSVGNTTSQGLKQNVGIITNAINNAGS